MFYITTKATATAPYDGIPARYAFMQRVLNYMEHAGIDSINNTILNSYSMSKIQGIVSTYNGNTNKLVEYLAKYSIKIDPIEGLHLLYPELYSSSRENTRENFKRNKVVSDSINAQNSLSIFYSTMSLFGPQMVDPNSKNDKGIDINSSLGDDEKSGTKGDLYTEMDYDEDYVSISAAKQIFKYIFACFWDMVLLTKKKKEDKVVTYNSYSLLANLWASSTSQWYANQARRTNDYNTATRYYKIYNDEVTYGPKLQKGEITSLVVNANRKKVGTNAINMGLKRTYAVHANSLGDSEHRSRLGTDAFLWGRYMHILLSLAIGRPVIDDENIRNYQAEDLINQLFPEEPSKYPEALCNKIPINALSTNYVERFQTFDEWVESLQHTEVQDYKLSSYVSSEINIPKIKILDDTLRCKIRTVESAKPKDIETLCDNIKLVKHLGKMFSSSNTITPYKTLEDLMLAKLIIDQEYDPSAKSAVLSSDLLTNDVNYYKESLGTVDDITLVSAITEYVRNINDYYNDCLPLEKQGDIKRALTSTDVMSSELRQYIENLKEEKVQLYFNKIYYGYYKSKEINSPFITQPKKLRDFIKRSIVYSGEAKILKILGDCIAVDIHIKNTKDHYQGVFLPNGKMLIYKYASQGSYSIVTPTVVHEGANTYLVADSLTE